MNTQLILKFEFVASHSLLGYEVPHPHIWKLETVISGKPIAGKILDIMALRELFQGALTAVAGSYLNENPAAGAAVMEVPTCETLCEYFFSKFNSILKADFIKGNPTVQLSSVTVGICGMDGVETGAVKLTAD